MKKKKDYARSEVNKRSTFHSYNLLDLRSDTPYKAKLEVESKPNDGASNHFKGNKTFLHDRLLPRALHHFSRGWPRITTIVVIILVSAKRNPANSRSRRLTTDRSFDLALIQSVCVSTRRPGPGEQNPPREYWCAVSAAGGGGGRSRMRAGKKGGGELAA